MFDNNHSFFSHDSLPVELANVVHCWQQCLQRATEFLSRAKLSAAGTFPEQWNFKASGGSGVANRHGLAFFSQKSLRARKIRNLALGQKNNSFLLRQQCLSIYLLFHHSKLTSARRVSLMPCRWTKHMWQLFCRLCTIPSAVIGPSVWKIRKTNKRFFARTANFSGLEIL